MTNLYQAQVVDNNDPDKAGRVKIKVPGIHSNVPEDLLPWAKQKTLFLGGSNTHGKSSIPEIDSLVWIAFDDPIDYLRPFYDADIQLNKFNPHKLFDTNVKSAITGFSSSYPDVKYEYYKNGICVAISSSDDSPEIAIYHPTGTNIFINKDGKINIVGKDDIEVTDKTSNKIKMSTDGITLYTMDGSLWKPNCLSNCIFSGSPHVLTTTIKGANA